MKSYKMKLEDDNIKMIKVSIIIPYYNADRYIARMLDSLLVQDLPKDNYEIIVVDDGSKEEPIVLKEYVHRFPNIIYVRQENSGPGTSRNRGMDIAKGEYLFFCDSDDFIAENILGNLYDIAHNRSLDMLFFNVPRIPVNEAIINPKRNIDNVVVYPTGLDYFARPIEKFISMGPCQYIINLAFIRKYNLSFPPDMIMNEDACFLIDAILVSQKTAKVDVDVYFYIQNPNSLRFSGKVLKAEKHTNNILLFISKLNNIISDIGLTKKMPAGCLKNLLWLKNQKSYIVLREGCKYLPFELFQKLILRLVDMNSYPKPFGNHIFKKTIILKPIVLKLLNVCYGIKRRITKK